MPMVKKCKWGGNDEKREKKGEKGEKRREIGGKKDAWKFC
jgi:hypothetical protein